MKSSSGEHGIEKTNVMRLLDQAGVAYTPHAFSFDTVPTAVEVAHILHKPVESVFKSLVTEGASHQRYVFMIPAQEELSLKKAAQAAGEKSIMMMKSKDLLAATGYVHGCCTPIGLKKPLKTFADETMELCDTVLFSAGRIGYQVEMLPEDVIHFAEITLADLTV